MSDSSVYATFWDHLDELRARLIRIIIAIVVLAVVAFLLAKEVPLLAGLIPIVNAALLASAAVWGASLMVNQISYVVAGLDGMDTIQGFIVFAVLCVCGMLLNIIAAFLPAAKEA